ncbi:predicted protein [Postia placenta Mad-698-R]|nr:predicted protein [Postia placenta Mad-698-R]
MSWVPRIPSQRTKTCSISTLRENNMAEGKYLEARGIRLVLTEAMGQEVKTEDPRAAEAGLYTWGDKGRLCALVRAQLVCAQHADAAPGAESIESTETILSALSLETQRANSSPPTCTLVLQHNSPIQPKNLDHDWYKWYLLEQRCERRGGAFVHGRSDARQGQSRAVRTSRGVVIYYDRGLRPPATRAPELASSFLTARVSAFQQYPARVHIKKLESSEDTEVYICTLSVRDMDGVPMAEPSKLDVVCKVKRRYSGIEELRDEHDCYVKLRDLQGREIPKCYGLFQSSGDALSLDRATRRSTWACLVFAYCGKGLPKNLICMPWEFKHEVIHRDLRTLGNVIVSDNGKPIIVDFGKARCDHQCGETEAIPFHVHAPFDQPCYELAEAAEATWLWKAREFMSKLGIPIPVRVIENDETTLEEKIVKIMKLNTPQEVYSPTPIDFRKEAENEIKRRAQIVQWGLSQGPGYVIYVHKRYYIPANGRIHDICVVYDGALDVAESIGLGLRLTSRSSRVENPVHSKVLVVSYVVTCLKFSGELDPSAVVLSSYASPRHAARYLPASDAGSVQALSCERHLRLLGNDRAMDSRASTRRHCDQLAGTTRWL